MMILAKGSDIASALGLDPTKVTRLVIIADSKGVTVDVWMCLPQSIGIQMLSHYKLAEKEELETSPAVQESAT